MSAAAEEAQEFYDTELCVVEEEYRAFTDCIYSLHRVVGDKINSFLPVISKEVAAKKTIHSDAMLRMQLEYLCYIDQDPPKPTTPKTTIRLSRTARAIRSFSPSRQGTPGAPVVSLGLECCVRCASAAFLERAFNASVHPSPDAVRAFSFR